MRQNSINLPNDYDKRILSHNQTNMSFFSKEVNYFGHVIGKKGAKSDPLKDLAVKEFPRPWISKIIKQFLGFAGCYRRFIPNFFENAKPLNFLKKNETFVWNETLDKAFRGLLCSESLLKHPDITKTFIVTTDASGHTNGCIYWFKKRLGGSLHPLLGYLIRPNRNISP